MAVEPAPTTPASGSGCSSAEPHGRYWAHRAILMPFRFPLISGECCDNWLDGTVVGSGGRGRPLPRQCPNRFWAACLVTPKAIPILSQESPASRAARTAS